jgi:hypothetical protein
MTRGRSPDESPGTHTSINNSCHKAAFCKTCTDARVTAIQAEQRHSFRPASDNYIESPITEVQDEETIQSMSMSFSLYQTRSVNSLRQYHSFFGPKLCLLYMRAYRLRTSSSCRLSTEELLPNCSKIACQLGHKSDTPKEDRKGHTRSKTTENRTRKPIAYSTTCWYSHIPFSHPTSEFCRTEATKKCTSTK